MFSWLGRVPAYRMAYRLGSRPPRPLNLTVSVLNRCNSRCQTCNVYEREDDLLSPDDYARIFHNYRGLVWLTLSGGEPSLRPDLPEITAAIVHAAAPEIINLPTNGILTDRILTQVDAIAALHPGRLIVNLSLDGLGVEHDRLRGVLGNWRAALATWDGLRDLRRQHGNLVLGIHTVISRFNVERFAAICDGLLELDPDSYITEVAQERVELLTRGQGIAPQPAAYRRAILALEQRLARRPVRGTAALIAALRRQYYRYVVDYLHRPREIWPCYAALMSAQLMPNGELWCCCVRGDALGDLRAADFDFGRVWGSPRAREVRRAIRTEHCHCPLANATYTNLLASPMAWGRAGASWVWHDLKQRLG